MTAPFRAALALVGGIALPLASADAASLQNIRIAPHNGFVRVVLDLDSPITFSAGQDGSLELHGLSGGGAVMNADGPEDAPLTRIVLAPDGSDTKLSFETRAKAVAKPLVLTPDSSGGHRLVVDLYPANASAASSPEAPAAANTASAPAATSSVDHAAVPPSGPAQSLPQAVQDSAPSTSSEASASPLDTVPMLGDTAPPSVASSGTTPEEGLLQSPALVAERALDRSDAAAACALAEAALKTEPHDLRALAVLGGCRLALGDVAAAREAFSAALEIDPSYHRARIGMAAAEARLGDASAARADYAKALVDNPPADDAYKIIAAMRALSEPDQTAQAATDAQTAHR